MNGLTIGKPAPEFEKMAVVDGTFKKVKLSDYKGKWTVLFFYPLDFTFVCPTEIIEFSKNVPKFKELNAQVLGVSVDSEYSHLAWINTPRKQGGLGGIDYPLISDLSKSLTKKYGILHNEEVALRGTFIIDPKGILRQIIVNGLNIGRSVKEVLRLVEALQFFDKNGTVCPVGWHKGDDTMIPDPKKKLEYFEKVNK